MRRFEIFTICRRPPVLQTDASVGMMKIVVRETEARKASGGGLPHPDNSVSKHCCGRVRMAIPGLCWPYPRAKSKSDQSLRKRLQLLSPFALGPMGKQEIS